MEDTQQVSAEDKYIEKKQFSVTESTLKIIAIICMAIDHVGAGCLERMMTWYGYHTVNTDEARKIWMEAHSTLFYTDMIFRAIGRVAFPVFCFMIVEGLFHTRSRLKYAVRLFIFGLISEVPFDLMLKGKVFYMDYQNVYFTLWLALLAIWTMDAITKALFYKNCHIIVKGIIMVLVTAVFGVGAELLNTDYGAFGVLAVAAIYAVKKFVSSEENVKAMWAGCIALIVSNVFEGCALVIIPFVRRYNGKRGIKLKWVFYLFYPVHLFIIYLVTKGLGYW